MPAKKNKAIVPFKNEINLLVGVPGSGKSTLAKKLVKGNGKVKLSRDELRHMLTDLWYPGEEIEHLVSSLIDNATRSALASGYDVILDNTHCNMKTLKETISKFGKEARIVLTFVGSELSMKQIKEQNLNRDKAVPEDVIDRMYKGFTHIIKNKAEVMQHIADVATQSFTPVEFVQDKTLPRAIIVDIDGTVAHMGNRRGPFDWKKVGLDEPDFHVLNVVRSLSTDYKIFFVSGRDGSCRKETLDWLEKHYLYSDYAGREWELLMRPEGNFEKDSIIKERIFKENFEGKYYIEMLFDDRDQVVKKYREMGLTVAQVAYGDF